MVKKLLWVLGVFVALAILAGLVVYLTWDSQRLGQALLAKAGDATGVRLEAESVRLGLLRGLELTALSASGETESGEYRVSLERVRLQHRPASLLSGDLVVERILLEAPKVELLTREGPRDRPERPADGEPAPPVELPGLRLEVREILVSDGFIRIRERGPDGAEQENLRLDGLNLTLRELVFDPAATTPLHGLSGRGELRVAEAFAGRMPIRDIRGMSAFREGILDARDLALSTDYGDLKADITVDLNPSPFTYRLTAAGEPLNVNRMVGMTEEGSLGPGKLQLEARGEGSDPEDLVGRGTLRLEPGAVPEHPVLVRAESVLGLSGLAGGPYSATDANFRIEAGRVDIRDFSIATPRMGLSLDGWADLDGPIEFALGMKVARQGVSLEQVPAAVLDALADSDGWILIPLKVSGTREEPTVTPDAEALLSQAGRGILQRFGVGRGESPLRRLIPRRD